MIFVPEAARFAAGVTAGDVIAPVAFALLGAILVFNFRGSADRLYDLLGKVPFGILGSTSSTVLRFFGGVALAVGALGTLVNLFGSG